MEKFSYFYKIYANGVMFLDRTGTITSPVRMKSLFPIPTFRIFTKSYEELCNERATELLRKAEEMGLPMYVFWSGGIDSTLVLVSLLKNATPSQKDNITVVMTDASVAENPRFYEEHVRGKLKRESGVLAPYLLFGGNYFIVNGEHNDQVFGSDMVARFIKMFGAKLVHTPYKRDNLVKLWDPLTQNPAMTSHILDIFERLRDAAPIEIRTHHDFFWWVNFTLKWQLVHTFVLTYMGPRGIANMSSEYMKEHYSPFYATDEFQLWSMNNLDKRIKDTWASYKWVCKDIIYEYTKDAYYRDNKKKHGSRFFMLLNQTPYTLIDENLQFSRSRDLAPYHNPVNDFL